MSSRPPFFEEISHHHTDLGELVLRRRRARSTGETDIYEVKLNDDLLMSSLLTDSERALATLALERVAGDPVEVLIGGLGLGETACAALADDRVDRLTVVELLPEIIGWHREGLLPRSAALGEDPRCRIRQGDFFDAVSVLPPAGHGAVLVDIDHVPDSWLHPDHARFYGPAGLTGAAALLREGGVFGFWSSGRADPAFLKALGSCFASAETHEIEVENPLVQELQVDTIYLGCGRKDP